MFYIISFLFYAYFILGLVYFIGLFDKSLECP